MTNYKLTPTFRNLQNKRFLEIGALQIERQVLEIIPRRDRTVVQQKRYIALANLVKTKQARYEKLLNLDIPSWDLLHILMEAEGTLWTPEEVTMWHKSLANTEGRGEEALRKRLGLSPDLTTEACDLVKYEKGVRLIYEEVKNLQGRRADGKFSIQEIQTSKHGRQMYCMWMMERAENGCFKGLNDELRRAFGTGEVGPKKVDALAEPLRADMMSSLSPTSVLSTWDAINGTTRNGFIRIPAHDAQIAWRFKCVTKSGLKYVLRESYIIKRLLETLLPVQDGTNKAA